MACGLIQHQDRRIGKNCSSDGDSLALSSGQSQTAFANDGFISYWKMIDELVHTGGPCGVAHVGSRGIRPAEPDIFGDGSVQQNNFLRYKSDLAAKTLKRVVLNVDSID